MSSIRLANRLLIANRGEIAVRIARTAGELGVCTVAIHAEDDANSLHIRQTDEVCPLKGIGASAYLDQDQIIEIAKSTGCDAIHPGYGFLSENAEFAARCGDENIVFVGPSPGTLSLFGDKVRARRTALDAKVPVLPATEGGISLDGAREFFRSLGDNGAMMLKAVGGGGGRGMRIVRDPEELPEALERCASEAESAFGNRDLYVEALISNALHIEVQIIADGKGGVSHLYERDCSLQRRHQKLVEIAPSPQLPASLRSGILDAAVALASQAGYDNIGTFEFLVDGTRLDDQSPFYFMEANPRLQVEHTVTEEVTGIDLVRAQLELAAGASLAGIGLTQDRVPAARGYAMQLRVNMEAVSDEAVFKPTGGTLSAFDPPMGPGVRVDTFGYTGYRTSPHYDSLLAKVIVSTSRNEFAEVVGRARRALSEFQIGGIPTNIGFLQKVLGHERVAEACLMTDFIDGLLLEINALDLDLPQRYVPSDSPAIGATTQTAGGRIDSTDPLAVLSYGKSKPDSPTVAAPVRQLAPDGTQPVLAAMQSTIVSVAVREGDLVVEGQELLVVNSMKMEHVIKAEISGIVRQVLVQPGVTVAEGAPLLYIEEAEVERTEAEVAAELDLENPRPDLAEVIRRRALTTDESRAERIEKRRKQGFRSTRENIEDLCDEGTFAQYGSLSVSPGLRGTIDELLDYDPSDGLVTGLAHINGHLFDEVKSRCMVMAYDWTVLAGTQGWNHKIKDRMFLLCAELESPLVLFAGGGGGRAGGGSRASSAPVRAKGGAKAKDPAPAPIPGVTFIPSGTSGMKCDSFTWLAKLSGHVPVIGITTGICFAGNAVLLSTCDVIIATANSNIGIGGPAMIEGGGLGIYRPDEIGPMSEQVPNGVVDIAVEDETEAVAAAKKYLSYFQGSIEEWECADQRLLRHAIPENRLRVYDIRKLIETLGDTDSVLELRAGFGLTMVTAFARIEGRPVGIVANNTVYKGGAIDSDGADKAARFMKICDNFNIPIVMLDDCPGIMVGPEDEKTALVRHAGRMFVVGAGVTVPLITVVLRKSYGLGGQAMGGGTHSLPHAVVAWPTSEFGPMGLEGQVKLGSIATLQAIEDPVERQATYERLVAHLYELGKGIWAAHGFEVDDMIDPADTRRWILTALKAQPPSKRQEKPKGHCIDAW